jgi:hypothetical protein
MLASPEGRGNGGAVESVENQKQVSHPFHRPLEISQTRRDFHIPTAQAYAAWKSGKPKSGFPLSHPAHATTTTLLLQNIKTKKGSRPLRVLLVPLLLSKRFMPPSTFMLILRLENAEKMSPLLILRPTEW